MQTTAGRAAILATFVCAPLAAAQPSLSPPAGAVAESGRFGTRIELTQATAPGDANSVFKIAQPGSYVLTGNLEVPTSEIGIEIASSDVTIDLNGYTIRAETDGSGVGVGTEGGGDPATYTGVRITGGTLASLEIGVDLIDSGFQVNTRRIVIDDLIIEDVARGITANSSSIRGCVIAAIDLGIRADNAHISGCNLTMTGVAATGIECFLTRVSDTRIDLNFGTVGVFCGNSQISGCSIAGPPGGNTGIADQGGNSIDTVFVIAQTGFDVPFGSSVIRDSAYFGGGTAVAGAGTPTLIDNNF